MRKIICLFLFITILSGLFVYKLHLLRTISRLEKQIELSKLDTESIQKEVDRLQSQYDENINHESIAKEMREQENMTINTSIEYFIIDNQ